MVQFQSCLVFELTGATLFLFNSLALFMEDADVTRFGDAMDECAGLSAIMGDIDALESAGVRETSDRFQQLAVGVGETVLEVAVRDDEH
jgi:hypothetical protein